MIRRQCLLDEHLCDIAGKRKIRDKQLLGRMIHALYLVEQLTVAGLAFTFKGGTCLSLITDRLDRLSIDVDIEVSKNVLYAEIEEVLNSITSSDGVFLRWESNVRPRDVEGTKHYKIHYRPDDGRSIKRKEHILLDVVRTSIPYQHVTDRALDHAILAHEGKPVSIVTPTLEGILGDKLTACAPLTVGVPIELQTTPGLTTGANKHLEMIKQLFDVNVLIPLVNDWNVVGGAFARTLEVQRDVFRHDFTIEQVVNDLRRRALAMFDQLETEYHPDLTSSHQDGHRSLSNYLVAPGAFSHEQVKMAALRAAYVMNSVIRGTTPLTEYPEIKESSLDSATIKGICKGLPKDLKAEAVAKIEALLGSTRR